MSMKICFKCKEEKSLDCFYKHSQMKDGHVNKCKDCNKKDIKINYLENIKNSEWHEKEKERHREKYYRLEYKEKHKQSPEKRKIILQKSREKYPEKYKAKNISRRVKKQNKENQLHHWNYSIEYAKDVIELSIKEHNLLHRYIKYDKNTFMYKDLKGNLLDTKEKHIDYMIKVFNI